MVNYAVVKTGGKQYLVKENDMITVDKLSDFTKISPSSKPTGDKPADKEKKEVIELETLAIFDTEGKTFELGTPFLTKKVKAEIIFTGKGEKIRVARFKAKVRYRKVRGFRPQLTTLKIIKV